MKKVTLLLALVCSLSIWAEPQHGVVYVKKDATGSGASWDDALGSIQAAINLAKATDDARKDVWVATGTYIISTPISMQDSVNVYGGFAGMETSLEGRAKVAGGKAWEFQNPTILQGDNSSLVNFVANYDVPTILDGFTITDGNGNPGNRGGGILLRTNGVVQNCIVTNCSTSGSGGGIEIYGGGAVRFSLIKGNRQTTGTNGGGGIFCNNSGVAAYIENCEIASNYSDVRGGGLGIQGAAITSVRNNIIYNNVAKTAAGVAQPGGAIRMGATSNEVVNNLIYNNTGSNSVYLYAGKFANNTVVKNAGGLYLASGTATGAIVNNIVWGCYTTATGQLATDISGILVTGLPYQNNAVYNTIPEDKGWSLANNIRFSSNASNGDILEPGEGTVGSGPKFVKVTSFVGAIDTIGTNSLSADDYNILFAELETADWSLNANSPCVNAGQNITYSASDITGAARPQGFPFSTAKTDIGAYELPYYPVAFESYDTSKGEIYGEDGAAVLTQDTLLAFAKGQEAIFYFIPTAASLPHKVYITPSVNGGLTYTGEKTDITSEIDAGALSWTTRVTFPFKITVEWMQGTSLNDVVSSQIRCTGVNHAISITGISQGENISIYHAGGTLIRQMQATGNNVSVSVPDGIYIVRIGDRACKVIVR